MPFLFTKNDVWLSRRHFLGTAGCLSLMTGVMGAEENPSPKFQLEWGKQGTAEGEFHFPIGIAVNRKDEVFVTDFYNNRVQKFSVAGKFLTTFPTVDNPGGLAIDGHGNLYIAHFGLTPNKKRNDERGRK